MAASMFDWLRGKKLDDQLDKKALSNQIATEYNDGALQIEDAVNNYILDFDWKASSQAELIDNYRETARYNEVDFAIEDIVNEAVSFSEDEDPITLDMTELEEELPEKVRDMFHESFSKISRLLELRDTVHRRFKSFYVDGRAAYQKVVDKENSKNGIIGLVELDARLISLIRNITYNKGTHTIESVQESFVYDPSIMTRNGSRSNQGVSLNGQQFKEALNLVKESVSYVTSGITDPKTGWAISWLDKAVTPANQLRMMENALVIYRITRAPERRVFYIDTAGLPKAKGEQYIRNLQSAYRNKMTYDHEAGSFKDKRHLQTMQEDFWLPRNSSGRGTEVSTLSGGANLGDIEDVLYFLRRLYKALNIPTSRLESDSLASIGGRASEINRDELKFSKFVSKVRKRFNILLKDMLRTDLILRNVITAQEWEEYQDKIKFVYAQDMYLEERKFFEMTRDRLELVSEIKPYVGTYYSNEYVRKEILRQTDVMIEELDNQIEEEKDIEQYAPKDEMGNLIPAEPADTFIPAPQSGVQQDDSQQVQQ